MKSTISDVLALGESHAELVDNDLIITDYTTTSHNLAVIEIASAIRHFIMENSYPYEVFTSSVALFCDDLCDSVKGNLFLPDIMCVEKGDGIRNDGVHTVPNLIVEVTSDTSIKLDYVSKMRIYSLMRIPEYLVIDLQRHLAYRYLSDNDFAPESITSGFSSIAVRSFPELSLDLSTILG